MFKKFFCGLVVCGCAAVSGMSEDVKEVVITERQQFFQIDVEQAKNITSISFEGQQVDDDFASKWDELFLNACHKGVSFERCEFLGSGIGIFNSLVVSELRVVDCALRVSDVGIVLFTDTYMLNKLCLAHNNLADDEVLLARILNDRIIHVFGIDTMDLRYNGLSDSFLERLDSHFSDSVKRLLF